MKINWETAAEKLFKIRPALVRLELLGRLNVRLGQKLCWNSSDSELTASCVVAFLEPHVMAGNNHPEAVLQFQKICLRRAMFFPLFLKSVFLSLLKIVCQPSCTERLSGSQL